jgi:hypothetical protein
MQYTSSSRLTCNALAALAPLLLLSASACEAARSSDATPPTDPVWVQVYASDEHWVALDTAHAARNSDGSWLVWFETRHAAEREQDGRRFNRERIRSLLRCEALAFKTVHVAMTLDDGPVVYERGGTLDDASRAPFRTVRPGTVDLPSMTRACALLNKTPG